MTALLFLIIGFLAGKFLRRKNPKTLLKDFRRYDIF